MRGKLGSVAVGAVAAAALLTACGGGGSGSASATGGSSTAGTSTVGSSTAGSSAASSSAGEAGSATQTVEVDATEFKLTLPTTHFAPGTYTFQMKDSGHATHAIEIQGPGVDGTSSQTAGPGGTAAVTVTLQQGTYTMWCPVGNHRALGMQTTLTVG